MNDPYGEFIKANTTSGVLPARTTVITGLPLVEIIDDWPAMSRQLPPRSGP